MWPFKGTEQDMVHRQRRWEIRQLTQAQRRAEKFERTPIDEIERVRNLLAFFLVGTFISMLPFLLYKDIPEQSREVFVYMIGQLSGMATTVLGFYFVNKVGQDALDAKRSENTGKLADAVTTALNTGSSEDPKPDVVLKPGETAQAQEGPGAGPRPQGMPDA